MAIKNTMMSRRGLKRLYLYLRRANRRRVLLLLSGAFLVLAVIAVFGYLFIQDLALSGQIFPGVSIEGNVVGGMTRDQAAAVVSESVAAPMLEPLVLEYEDREFKLDVSTIDMSIDVKAMVDQAYAQGRGKLFLSRMLMRFMNRTIEKDVPVILKYDDEKLNAFVDTIAVGLNVSARSSVVDMSSGTPKISSSRYGLSVDEDRTREAIIAVLPTGNRRIPVVAETVRPEVTEADLGYIIVVRQSEHKLYLYRGEEFVDDFAVALGSPEYPTPNGRFTIVKKEKNPTWYPPKSDWARELSSAPIPPGPGNPLGPYWMEIGNGIGIHAALDPSSLGYSASHGCIRVSEWAAGYLFERVEKGTPVYIYP